ncbi:isoaspartyl peptidase/L-asparaginase family protein [Corallococcus exiguus]|uniref:Isoaspartyl peptidase n=1 Tax=Corallococcus exiguus TaxID=83462 RepID=A0A7X4Y6S2_9BACT|nr:isoaspartyl peptidase/L-asparaginase [Corallococcus exiguus]NBC39184.1 isoaspartyl peptidase/L-asparaginase [Corallococcus exiguus]TNV54937.1 isoaspartyl peptidase/L-asparaginase [Corallococcus exiguus]
MSPSFSSRMHRGLLASTALLLAPLGCATSSHAGAARDEAALRTDEPPRVKPKWGLVIHGGAGVISRENLTPEREAAMRAALTQALQAGHAVLAKGGRSMDAVTAAIRVMEDSPYFNAGKGAVFNHDGVNELDAAVMDGKTRMAGAVAGVHHIQNPIDLARLVMEKSPHVMMVGDGAEAFAQSQGMPLVDAKYFYTEERWQGLQRALEQERAKGAPPAEQGQPSTQGLSPATPGQPSAPGHPPAQGTSPATPGQPLTPAHPPAQGTSPATPGQPSAPGQPPAQRTSPATPGQPVTPAQPPASAPPPGQPTTPAQPQPGSSLTPGVDPITGDHKFGTVGAVALDMEGNLAAGTSTGGMTNKRFGRVGDAPIIGAGTYADERCAVSATGHGEFFIRYTVARDICARVEYQDLPLPEAASYVINDVLVKAGGEGGVIAMDRQGHVAMPFNSSGMYRGYISEDGTPTVAIFQQP